MLVNVTKNDIENGERCSQKTCMVSKALLRQLKRKVGYVKTTQDKISIGKTDYVVSEGLANRINDFDDEQKVKPFVIRLNREKLTAAIAK